MLNRRSFILGGLALYEASARPLIAAGAALQNQKFPVSPFTLGVASGDPSPDGVVLWTRLAPDPLNGGGMPPHSIQVDWEVATDDRMMGVVRNGRTSASPASAHSVHVEVSRPRTASLVLVSVPRRQCDEPDRPHADVSGRRARLSSACASRCVVPALRAGPLHRLPSTWRNEDLDLVLHLGDYIYEDPGIDNRVRKHVGGELIERSTTIGTATRNTGAIRRCRPRTPRSPWLVTSGTTTRSTTTTRARFPRRATRSRRSPWSPRRRVPGLLRAHAAAAQFAADRPRRCSSTGQFIVRHAGELLRARHTPVPQRSALRRRGRARLQGHARSAGHDAGTGAGEMANRWPRALEGGMERSGPAGA